MALKTSAQGLRIVADDDNIVLDLAPLQGLWTQAQYFRLTDHSRRLIEFTDGSIEVLPMPTDRHQTLSRFLLFALFAYIQPLGGTVLYAPLHLQIREGRFREPDLLLVRDANDPGVKIGSGLGPTSSLKLSVQTPPSAIP